MPQLDSASFFSQYIWLVIFFFGFHYYLVTSYLPKIAKILRVRQLKSGVDISSSDTNKSNDVQKNISKLHEVSDSEPFIFAQKTVRESLQNVATWLQTMQNAKKNTSQNTSQINAKEFFLKKIEKIEYRQKSLLQDYKNATSIFSSNISHSNIISNNNLIQNRAKSQLFVTQKAISVLI